MLTFIFKFNNGSLNSKLLTGFQVMDMHGGLSSRVLLHKERELSRGIRLRNRRIRTNHWLSIIPHKSLRVRRFNDDTRRYRKQRRLVIRELKDKRARIVIIRNNLLELEVNETIRI